MQLRSRFARRVVSLAAVVLLASLISPASVLGGTHSPPWADMVCTHYSGSGGLDTRQSCTNAVTRLNTGGYFGFNDVGVSAYTAMGSGYAQDDAIWAMFGHGGPGQITTEISGGAWTYLNAVSGLGMPCTSPHTCLYDNYSWSQLHKIRLMIFGGCHTAETRNGYNLPSTAVGKGVDAAVGWTGEIYWPHMDTWTDGYFLAGITGSTIFNSALIAEQRVLGTYGNYGGTNNSVFWGAYNSRIQPPAYGS